jgi:hypothetical protein
MTYSPGCIGVDAFAYDWISFGLCWIFTEPAAIGRALHYAKLCKAHVLLLAPQWRNSYFYPLLSEMRNTRLLHIQISIQTLVPVSRAILKYTNLTLACTNTLFV